MRTLIFFFLAIAVAASGFAQPPQGSIIVLIGPPGSGKTTQARFIRTNYKLPVITTEDLIRARPAAVTKYRTPGIYGGEVETDPVMNDLLREHLKKMDTRSGFVLDGYPATKEQADYLATLVRDFKLRQPIVIQIDVSDEEARRRLRARGRSDDTPANIEQRLKDYHRELDLVRAYYPEANIWTINGAKTPAEVSKTIAALLDDPKSFELERSTRP